MLRDNSHSPEILSGVDSLFNQKEAPDFDAFDPDIPGASSGLNYEHIISGHKNGNNSFTPREGKFVLSVLPDGNSAMLAIESVDVVDERRITKQDAKRAGYKSREALLAELNTRREGTLYRIALHHAGDDPRHELRERDDVSQEEMNDVKTRLANMDVRSSRGPWTTTTLALIATNPGKRAAELAESIGMETKRFKGNVRKLKELGLTESLKVGYRLSPRGEVVFQRIKS
jgi:hypothetical protein